MNWPTSADARRPNPLGSMRLVEAVASAEAEHRRVHDVGECHLSGWSCSYCEVEAGPRCQYVSPSAWGATQCALPDGHDDRHAYEPSEALT